MAQTVLITGCDHGVGAALAALWADRGAEVFAGVLKDPSDRAEPRASGGSIRRVCLDIGSGAGVASAAALVGSWAERLDVVVNNAAILGNIEATLFDAVDFDEILRVYQVNAVGSLRVTQAFLPLLLAGGLKLVVNVSSEAGSIGACTRSNWYAYAMSKAAFNQQSHLVHNLLRPRGGRVLVVHPGHVRTFMRGAEDATGALSPAEAALGILDNVGAYGLSAGEHPEFRGPGGERLPW